MQIYIDCSPYGSNIFCNKLLQLHHDPAICLFQRWVQAFRSSKFHVRITTNNGVERQNRALKHEYLVAYRDRTLSGLMTVLVERFFPDAFRK